MNHFLCVFTRKHLTYYKKHLLAVLQSALGSRTIFLSMDLTEKYALLFLIKIVDYFVNLSKLALNRDIK